jgi:hypothetical protein
LSRGDGVIVMDGDLQHPPHPDTRDGPSVARIRR